MPLLLIGTIPDMSQMTPHMAEEHEVLTDLLHSGVLTAAYFSRDEPHFIAIAPTEDQDAVLTAMNRLPLVSNKVMTLTTQPVQQLGD